MNQNMIEDDGDVDFDKLHEFLISKKLIVK